MEGDALDNQTPPEAAPRRFRALVVDDERDFRYLMMVFLKRSGLPMDVDMAADGFEALKYAQRTPPDLIVLDVMMPGMDGFEVCRRIRNDPRTRDIPVIILTALDEAADRARAFEAGTDDFLSKPFDRAEMIARVRRILQRTYAYEDLQPGEPTG